MPVITELPSKRSMFVTVSVGTGYAQTRSAASSYHENYQSALLVTDVQTILQPTKSFQGQACSSLVVHTSMPLQFLGLTDAEPVAMTINRLLVLDQEFTSFSLTNVMEGPASVSISFAQAEPQPEQEDQ